MNQLDILIEERHDLSKAKECLTESLKYLNIMRDLDIYQNIDKENKRLKKQIDFLDSEIEITKQSFNAIVVTQEDKGLILVAKNLEDTDVFLRVGFLPERMRTTNLIDAFVFDWVDKIVDECFITYKNYSITEEEFKKIYTYHKKNNNLEKNIKNKSLKMREVDREIKHNYIFKENK